MKRKTRLLKESWFLDLFAFLLKRLNQDKSIFFSWHIERSIIYVILNVKIFAEIVDSLKRKEKKENKNYKFPTFEKLIRVENKSLKIFQI